MARTGVPFWDAEALRAARVDAGLGQAELAGRVGMSRVSVTNYERGRFAPAPAGLVVLARTLGVPPRALLGREARGLAVLRSVAGLSQGELVERFPTDDLGLSAYRAIESGRIRRLRRSDAEAIAAAVGSDQETVLAEHAFDVESYAARQESSPRG